MNESVDELNDKQLLCLLRACLAKLVGNGYKIDFNPTIDAWCPEDYAGHFRVYKQEDL